MRTHRSTLSVMTHNSFTHYRKTQETPRTSCIATIGVTEMWIRLTWRLYRVKRRECTVRMAKRNIKSIFLRDIHVVIGFSSGLYRSFTIFWRVERQQVPALSYRQAIKIIVLDSGSSQSQGPLLLSISCEARGLPYSQYDNVATSTQKMTI